MPVLMPLNHKLMYIIRQQFNRINQSQLKDLSPQETLRVIEDLLKPPLNTKQWLRIVCEEMQILGLNQENDLKNVASSICALLKHKKAVALVKTKLMPIRQSSIANPSAASSSTTLSSSDEQLVNITKNTDCIVGHDQIASQINDALGKGANPNLVIENIDNGKDPIIMIFADVGLLGAVHALATANVDLEAMPSGRNLLSVLFQNMKQVHTHMRTRTEQCRIDQYLRTFQFLLDHGVNPDLEPSILIKIIDLFKTNTTSNAAWKSPFLQLMKLFLDYGADHAAALAYAKANDGSAVAIQILEKYHHERLSRVDGLVDKLKGVAQQVRVTSPNLVDAIMTFSSVLQNKRRAPDDLQNHDWKIKEAFHSSQAAICSKQDKEAHEKLKKAKKEIKEVEQEIGLRPK